MGRSIQFWPLWWTPFGIPGLPLGPPTRDYLVQIGKGWGNSPWRAHPDPTVSLAMVSPKNSVMFTHRITSNNTEKAMTLCTNSLSTPWILRLSLSCFCGSVGKVWGHLGQVTFWVACKGPGREEALSDFDPLKKTSTFEFVPHPAQGVHTLIRWSLAWDALTCALPHVRNRTSLACCGATWWEGEVGLHQPKLRTSPRASQGTGGRKGCCSKLPPVPPHCLGRWPLHPPQLSFQGSGALANTPGVTTWMLGLISARLVGDCPMVRATSPEEGKWVAPSRGEQCRCE